jgi:O-antigen ligase
MPVLFSRSLSFAFLVLAWTLPYAITLHTYPIPTFYAEYTALALYALLGAAVFVAAHATRERAVFATPRVALVPLLFGVLLFAQPFLLPTAQPTMNLLGGCFLLAALMAACTGFWVNRLGMIEPVTRTLSYALLVGGVFAVFCQIIQLLHLETRVAPFVVSYNVQIWRRPFGNMAQANHLATYIAFALAAALYLVQKRRLPYVVWIVLSIVYAMGQALTVSRGPWLQTGVVVLGGFWMAFEAGRGAGRSNAFGDGGGGGRLWVTPILLLAIFVGVNIATRWANVHFDLQLGESAAERFKDAGQIAPRLALWKYGLTMFQMHPWLGVGWGEFPRLQYDLVDRLGRVEIANNSHNIVIDLLAKTGVVGLAIVVLGLGLWLARALRGNQRVERVFGFTLLAALLMHALVEYPQQYMFFLLPAWFVIGMLDTTPLRRVSAAVSRALLGALVSFGIVALYPVYRDYARAEVLYYGANPYDDYRANPSVIFAAWGEYGLATLVPLDKSDIATKLAMHRQAMALLPGETVVRRYAILQAISGETEAALDTVRRLKIFADELKDWPAQLAGLYRDCDNQPALLGAFRKRLAARYGSVPSAPADDEGDSGD